MTEPETDSAERPRDTRGPLAWLRDERAVVTVVAIASALAFVVWGGSARPMEDTVDYRLTAEVLRTGWHSFPDRAPGYPVLLLLTGASRDGNAVLFLVQLLAHAVAIFLVVDLARRVGVGRRGRLAIAVLLLMPPVLQSTAYVGTETFATLGVVTTVWLVVRWLDTRRLPWLVAAGATVGLVTLVRPTYQLLVVPLAALVWAVARRHHPWRTAAALFLPFVVLVGPLALSNLARFDTPAVDRLFPYHLSEKTALVVEYLPETDEPTRSILVDSRDDLLAHDGEHSPAAYLFQRRAALEDATGLHGSELDRWVLRRDLHLIRDHPLAYLQSAEQASVSYVQVDPRDAADGGREWFAGFWHLVHLALAALFAAVAVLVPGVVLTRGMDRRLLLTRMLCWLVVLYTGVVTVFLVNGEPRTRAPTDPLLALLLVTGIAFLRAQRLHLRPPKAD